MKRLFVLLVMLAGSAVVHAQLGSGPVSGGGGSAAWDAGIYNPDRPPSSYGTGGYGEEFTDGVFSQAWQWGNQGPATDVVEQDMAKLDGPGAVAGHVLRGVAAPTGGTDFTVTAKLYPGHLFSYSTTDGNGIFFLDTGTLAAPTKFYEMYSSPLGNYVTQLYTNTMTGLNTWSATQLNFQPEGAQSGLYMQGRYTASTKTIGWHYSINGRIWTWGADVIMTNHPSYVGRFTVTGDNPAYWEFFRVRTGANRNLAGE